MRTENTSKPIGKERSNILKMQSHFVVLLYQSKEKGKKKNPKYPNPLSPLPCLGIVRIYWACQRNHLIQLY